MTSQLGNQNTASETLFEQYLVAHGLYEWTHEEPVPGKSTTPDYCLRWQQRLLYFEVKEWKAQPVTLDTIDLTSWDTIREKITQAARQFKHYKERSCSVVLANPNRAPISLDENAISGAMFGDVGFVVPIDAERGEVLSVEKTFFKDGKMQHHVRGIQNTTFSAVLVLEHYYHLRKHLVQIDRLRRYKYGAQAGNKNLLYELPDPNATPLRMVVYENPNARIRLPDDLFLGPYDERFGADGKHYTRIFAGCEIAAIESECEELQRPV